MSHVRQSLVLLSLAAVAACSKKQPPAPTPAPVPAVNEDSIRRVREAEMVKRRADSIAAENARRAAAAEEDRRRAAAAAAAVAEARRRLETVIYFDYDKDDVRADQQATLDAKVPVLNANPDVKIRIAGHTDERGSDEYNLALGQRRAASVRRYLVARGVAEGRFEVTSFGEQRPAAPGEGEDAWSKNRRAEFEIIAGAGSLKAP